MEIDALTWNLFNGRDAPPDPALFTWRSRLWGASERNDTHLQVNRDLLPEFAAVLAPARWQVALLQECPPRWARSLAEACDAEPHPTLTSRNWLSGIRGPLARRNPDLLGAWGGGSNLTLIRGRFRGQALDRRELLLRRRPERRKVDLIRLSPGICVSNLHASGPNPLAAADVRKAADAAAEWAGDQPLILGGDFNLRPGDTRVFDELADRHGLVGAMDPTAIDHLLVRGMDVVERPRAWPPAAREVPSHGRAIRLSDHPPVSACFSLAEARSSADN